MLNTDTQGERMRRVIFRPYSKGQGPTFTLQLFELTCNATGEGMAGQERIGYTLHMREPNGPSMLLFDGDDYGVAPSHAIDGDASVEGLMSFLTLRPGDTDEDYFEAYTPMQLDYCEQHAESLSMEASCRFGE